MPRENVFNMKTTAEASVGGELEITFNQGQIKREVASVIVIMTDQNTTHDFNLYNRNDVATLSRTSNQGNVVEHMGLPCTHAETYTFKVENVSGGPLAGGNDTFTVDILYF